MEATEMREKYYALNKSFKRKFVFHLGYDAGFFSEYNNMILAMLYCLTHKIQFTLYSEDANFGYQYGWTDYFFPFCDETNDDFHKKYNFRNYDFIQERLGIKDKLKIKAYKVFNGINFLSQDLWLLLRDRKNEKNIYNIPEIGIINCSLKDACRELISLTWQYNEITAPEIKNKIRLLNLPEDYIGFHIRRGDKHIEQDLVETSSYLNRAENISNIKNTFILTDDFRVISEIRNKYKEWTIFTFCKESEQGYDHAKFKKENKSIIKEAHLNLFASLDVLNNSTFFVGTFGSNPGMYLGMRMDSAKCISIDIDWQIW